MAQVNGRGEAQRAVQEIVGDHELLEQTITNADAYPGRSLTIYRSDIQPTGEEKFRVGARVRLVDRENDIWEVEQVADEG